MTPKGGGSFLVSASAGAGDVHNLRHGDISGSGCGAVRGPSPRMSFTGQPLSLCFYPRRSLMSSRHDLQRGWPRSR